MAAVVDASVAIKWVVAEPGSAAARRLIFEQAGGLSAPALIQAECGNILWRKVRKGELERRDALLRYDALNRIPLGLVHDEELAPLALRLAIEIDHPIYDCLYLAAALVADGVVVTADRGFARAAKATSAYAHRVRLLDVA